VLGDGPRRALVRRLVRSLVAGVRRSPPADLAVGFLFVPAVLVALQLWPGSAAWRLSLSAEGVFASRWTLWTAFASSFVHSGWPHLLDNLVSYWLVAAALYPLAALAGWRRRLAETALALLSIVPFVSAWASLAVLGPLTDLPASGFSDVAAALLGTLLVVEFVALERLGGARRDADAPRVDARWSGVAFALSLAMAFGAPSRAPYFPRLPVVAALCLLVAGLAATYLRLDVGWPRPVDLPEPQELAVVYGACVVGAGVVGSLLLAAPGTNVPAHLAGYVVGFVTPYAAFVLPRSA